MSDMHLFEHVFYLCLYENIYHIYIVLKNRIDAVYQNAKISENSNYSNTIHLKFRKHNSQEAFVAFW